MENRYPYPPPEALQPPGVSNNYSQSSYNASRPPHSMSANAANTSSQGGSHASSWNTSQMHMPPPTLPRQQNFQTPPMPQLQQFHQSEPPPPIPGIDLPASCLPPPSSFHPPPGHPPLTGPHPLPGPGLAPPPHHPPPAGLRPPHGPGFTPPLGHPPPPGFHPPHGPGFTPPTHNPPQPVGQHPSPGAGFTRPTGHFSSPGPSFTPPAARHPPPTGFHPPPRPGLSQPTHLPPPTGHHPPHGPGFAQPNYPPPAIGLHSSHSPCPSPRPSPPFARPTHGSGSGVQISTQKQFHPEGSGKMSHFFQETIPAVKPPQPEDETTVQRRADEKWVKQFLESKGKLIEKDPKQQSSDLTISDMKKALYSTAQCVSQLSALCEYLRLNIHDQKAWTDSYSKGLHMKQDIHGKLKKLSNRELVERMKTKLSNIAKKRARRRRAKQQLKMDAYQREVEKADKDVAIERWRMKQIHAEEEKKKEQELKVAADAVLCEVRKKLSDVKRMQNILKSLEKLRKLRKEAATRKGICTDPQSDETFNNLLEELRDVAKKRTAVYAAEEKALMVMVEDEQEEERRRDLEIRRQKERDKQLRKKRTVDAMLFGDDTPADPLMQPFRQYYTQAEDSLPALVQIRHEWDVFLVPTDHPDGSAVPQGWVIPDAPSDQAWASALQTSECEV